MKIQYVSVPDGAALLSCEGNGPSVCLPEQVEGLPLREICAYAFSSENAAKESLPAGSKVHTVGAGFPSGMNSGLKYLGGPSLHEIVLPFGIQCIGTYAFYNCTGLSRISLSAGIARVGNGAFMNCGALNEICFDSDSNIPTCLPGLLTEILHEVRVVFRSPKETSIWIFPEYYDELVENSAAHIFEHFIEGAGYRYRQCFQDDRLDVEAYDRQFSRARAEAAPETAIRIALARLRYPCRLTEDAGKRYLFYLKENIDVASQILIHSDDPDGLTFLAERGVFTRENIGAAIEAAVRSGKAECLSVLLNEQHNRYAPSEKTFDL